MRSTTDGCAGAVRPTVVEPSPGDHPAVLRVLAPCPRCGRTLERRTVRKARDLTGACPGCRAPYQIAATWARDRP